MLNGAARHDDYGDVLISCLLETPLGAMRAIADDKALYFLKFADKSGVKDDVEKLRRRINAVITAGSNAVLDSVGAELNSYFNGSLKQFTTPVHLLGTVFQKDVWAKLMNIPYGATRGYAEQASLLGKPSHYRAVAGANAANSIAIIIPCHRVINSNGELGGYYGGIERKKWLITHESQHLNPVGRP